VRVCFGSAFAVELDCSGFLGCGSEVAFSVAEAEDAAAVVVVMIKMDLFAFE
jgi:hypothetical protein